MLAFTLAIPDLAPRYLVTLNQLRTFLAVADNESVHGAAQQLVVTQAAVSASLAALQKGLGLALVAPDGRGLRLTDAGKAYAGYARRILGLLDEAGLAAAASADPERGELRLAAVTTAAEQVVPRILGGFRRQHPLTGIRLEAGNRERVRSLLDRHQVDLVVSGRPEPGWEVRAHAVRPHELVVVAAPDLAGEAARTSGPAGLLTWLGRQTWLLREPGSGTRASTTALLAELDIAPLTLIVGSNGAIRESVSVGLGVTMMSRDAVASELAAGRLAELAVPGTPLHRDWYLAARTEPLPPPAARLVEHVLLTGAFRVPDREEPA
jgi:LysR family transcriptional regulator, low CO2-responsive transcriptional regulator